MANETKDKNEAIEMDYLRWPVAIDGYRWVDTNIVILPKKPFYIYGLGGEPPFLMPNGERANIYTPMIDTPLLFQEFADLDISKDRILEFANKYGVLGESSIVFFKSKGQENHWGEGLDIWTHAISRMKLFFNLWEMAEKWDFEKLSKFFRWYDNQVEFAVGYLDGKIIPGWGLDFDGILSAMFQCFPLSPKVESENPRTKTPAPQGNLPLWAYRYTIADDSKTLPRFFQQWKKNEDYYSLARVAIAKAINEHLSQKCSPRLLIDKEGKFKPYFVPHNLLFAMWFQFYKAFIGEIKIRRCEYCNQWMNITDSRKDKRYHSRCALLKRKEDYDIKHGKKKNS